MFSQDIFRTTCRGNVNQLDSLLSAVSTDTLDDRGRSLLHWAVGCNKKEAFRYLLDRGVQVNVADYQNNTPLHVSIQMDNQFYFDSLIQVQTNRRWISDYGLSLLESAITRNRDAIVKQLLENGVPVNERTQRGSLPLEIARRMKSESIETMLVDAGANISLIKEVIMEGDYMGQADPGKTREIFAPQFISTEEYEFGSIFNEDGTEFYYGVDLGGRNEIRVSKLENNTWTSPEKIIFHDVYGYNDPFLSIDEQRLYYISDQALDGEGEPKDIDIWYSERTDDGWSAPINAGDKINTDQNEYYISFTENGAMCFSSNGHKDVQEDNFDIYLAPYKDGEFQDAVPLGPQINTDSYEADVFMAPDESYIIFCSTREGGFGQGDLYISFRNSNGQWTDAKNMGPSVNSEFYEFCPFVSKDGKYLFFSSNRDIYWINTEVFDELKN